MRYEYTETGIEAERLHKYTEKLTTYRERLRGVIEEEEGDAPEAALTAPFDASILSDAEKVVQKIGSVRHVVLVGIGGSSVGTLALYAALKNEETPLLHVLDIVNAGQIDATLSLLMTQKLADFAIVVVSKSGTTTETLVNADVLLSGLEKAFGKDVFSRVLCIGNEGTPLAKFAEEKNILYTAMPQVIGGRFSVFTAVGLIPALLLELDVRSFITGARDLLSEELLKSGDRVAPSIASILAAHIERGTQMYALFSENDRLQGFTAWYQQLIAESLGKITKEGKRVGLAPILMSSRELHSTAQLYLSGFENVLTHFFAMKEEVSHYTISEQNLGALVSLAGDRAYDRIPEAIMGGTHAAYKNEKLPHLSVTIEMNARDLGALMASKMLEIIYVAHLLSIDAFDQPHVELYKKETRSILQSA